MSATGSKASAALQRAKRCCGHYTTVITLATLLAGGALGVFFGRGYWDDSDGQIVFGSLGIFFALCWGLVVRYANVPTRFREKLPWLVKQTERVTAWSSQCFLIFMSAAILNEKLLRPLVTCTISRQSTGIIAAAAFFGGSVALPEPTQVNSLVVNIYFLVSVVLRNYNNNANSFYAMVLSVIGVLLLTIRYYASHTKVFTKLVTESADNLYTGVQNRKPGTSKVKVEGYKAHVFWDLCHHLNISWASVFSLYYMIQGWEESLDLHETKFWIPLVSGIGAMLVRFFLHRKFWGMLKAEMLADTGSKAVDVPPARPPPLTKEAAAKLTKTKESESKPSEPGFWDIGRGVWDKRNREDAAAPAAGHAGVHYVPVGRTSTWRTTPSYTALKQSHPRS